MEGAEPPHATTGRNASASSPRHAPGVRLLLKTIFSQGEREMKMPLGKMLGCPLCTAAEWVKCPGRLGPLWSAPPKREAWGWGLWLLVCSSVVSGGGEGRKFITSFLHDNDKSWGRGQGTQGLLAECPLMKGSGGDTGVSCEPPAASEEGSSPHIHRGHCHQKENPGL